MTLLSQKVIEFIKLVQKNFSTDLGKLVIAFQQFIAAKYEKKNTNETG